MFSDRRKQEIKNYLDNVHGKVYIGCDSVVSRRYNKERQRVEYFARYAVVLIVHIDNRHGCKIFSYTEVEPVYDQSLRSPKLRLMNEVYKSVECFDAMSDILSGREVEIHIDVNPSPEHASNSIVKQAVGYVKGVTSLNPVIKPDAWAGSATADCVARGKIA